MGKLTLNLTVDYIPTSRDVIDVCWELENEMSNMKLTAENAFRMVDEIRRRIAERIVISVSKGEEE